MVQLAWMVGASDFLYSRERGPLPSITLVCFKKLVPIITAAGN